MYIKVGALNLKLGNANGIYKSSTTLDVENKLEIYAAHIGSQDGKERYYQTDYDQVCCFYAKSRGIKETNHVVILYNCEY